MKNMRPSLQLAPTRSQFSQLLATCQSRARTHHTKEISVDPEAPSLHIPPPQLLLALSELEFNKVFLLLTYIPGKDLGWKDLSMVAFEAAVWERILVPQQTVDCHSNGIVARVISVMSLLTAVTHSSASLLQLVVKELRFAFDQTGDNNLRPQEIEDLFSTAPESPWKDAPYDGAAEKTALGGLSVDAFLSLWSLMTILEPAKSVEYLIYIGFPGDPSSAIRLTRRRRLDRKKQQCERKVFQCFVFGPNNAGKSALLNCFLGRSYENQGPTTDERYAVNMVDDSGSAKKTLAMREIPDDGAKGLFSSKESLAACDIAVFVYDSSDESSWKRATELLVEVATHGEATGYEVPCLMVSAKDDLDSFPICIQESTREESESEEEEEGHGASGVSVKYQKRKLAKLSSIDFRQEVIPPHSVASAEGCLPFLKLTQAYGIERRAAGKRTPRFPVPSEYEREDREGCMPPSKRAKKQLEADDDDTLALAMANAVRRGKGSPYRRAEVNGSTSNGKMSQAKEAQSKHGASSMVRNVVTISRDRRHIKAAPGGALLVNTEGAGTVEKGKNVRFEEAEGAASNDSGEAGSANEGFKSGDEFEALQALAALSGLLSPDELKESESNPQLKEDRIANNVDEKPNTPETFVRSYHRRKSKQAAPEDSLILPVSPADANAVSIGEPGTSKRKRKTLHDKMEFIDFLNHLGIGTPRLTRLEWSVIKSSLGRTRRFSEKFIQEERDKLKQYRESARKHYTELRTGAREELLIDFAQPLSVGNRVIAIHPKTREVRDGKILAVDHNKCNVLFDDSGVDSVMDIDIMPLNPLEYMPDGLMRQIESKEAELNRHPSSDKSALFPPPVLENIDFSMDSPMKQNDRDKRVKTDQSYNIANDNARQGENQRALMLEYASDAEGLGTMPSIEAMRHFVKILEEGDSSWYPNPPNSVPDPAIDVQISQSTKAEPSLENGGSFGETMTTATEDGRLMETQDKDVVLENPNTISVYNQWTAPLTSGHPPKARYEHGAAVIQDKMYMYGGNHNGRYLGDLHVLDLKNWTWSRVETKVVTESQETSSPATLTHCAGHSLIPWDNKLLSIGGHAKDPSESILVKVFDLHTCTWSILKTDGKPPISRGGQSVTLVGKKLVIFGGQDVNKSLLNDLHLLDLDTMTWDEIDAVGSPPSPRSDHAAAVHAERYLLIFGGGSHTNCFSDLHVLDLQTMEWSRHAQQGEAPTPRAGHAGVTIGENWFIVGGGDNKSGMFCTFPFETLNLPNKH
ncbi:hypothetical protein F2Q70_00018611, partial [Brassica cretica]